MKLQANSLPLQPNKTFRQWYEEKFKTRMPLYLETEVKKKLHAEYEEQLNWNKIVKLKN